MRKEYTLTQIAAFLSAELRGDADYLVNAIAPLDKAVAKQISFLGKAQGFNVDMSEFLATTQAGAVILAEKDAKTYSGNALIVENPYICYAKLTSWFAEKPSSKANIHPTAVIGDNCNIHESAIIGANSVIGADVTIGADCHIYPNVTLYHNVRLGERVIVHSGAVLGADGFGMANDHGTWIKIHQLGGVQIGNDVEIGANTCIDRGALDDTIVESGVKLDNHIQVGHNVKIGANTAIAGCTAIAGSATIGKYCMIGGAVTINGHITIADQTVITGASVVGMSIDKPGIYSSGFPVQPHMSWFKIVTRVLKINELVARVRKLEEK